MVSNQSGSCGIHENKEGTSKNHFFVQVSTRFVVLSLLSSTLVAFAVGQISCVLIEGQFLEAFVKVFVDETHAANNNGGTPVQVQPLPNPVVKEGKAGPPEMLYTVKYFDSTISDINSRWVTTDAVGEQQQCVADVKNDEEGDFRATGVASHDEVSTEDEEEMTHLPQGQHLLMDIEHVKGDFLNSQVRLVHAMLDLVAECGLTLLSYHCHGLKPSGVSCAGVLLESHVSFHTWPVEGVITLDLYTCGDESLLPVVPVAKRLFGIANEGSDQKPHAIWAHKLRGFSGEDTSGDSAATDFYAFPIGEMIDMKEKVVSAQTDFQRVDIYDVLLPVTQSVDGYEKSLKNDGSYEADHPELFQPDRIVFLDGVMQSRRSGDAAYHEALVHPAMFAHSNPKRVAIIGGGEGATLREVLKHKTVEKVVMIEIDEQMVKLSREYLPDWSDCSMLEGSADSCFEDPRVELYCEDAFAWFIDRFSGNEEDRVEESFDVIIMDALDPQIQISFVEALYDGGPFLRSLPRALNDTGIVVAQVGQSPLLDDPAEHLTSNKNRANFLRSLTDLGFEGIRDYQEARGGFFLPWQFVVAFKSLESQAQWFDDEATFALKIRIRVLPSLDGRSPLRFFDSATMKSYQYPYKGSEVVYCRGHPEVAACVEGHGLNPEKKVCRPASGLEIESRENSSLGVLAKDDVPQMSCVGLEEKVPIIYMPPRSFNLITEMDQRCASLLGNNMATAISAITSAVPAFLSFFEETTGGYNPAAERQSRHYSSYARAIP